MHTWGNLWYVFVLVSIGAATFSSFGLIVASVTNTMQETQVINNLIWSAFLFLSGATVPLSVLPGWIQRVCLFSPATYMVTGLQGAMTHMATPREVLTDVIALAVGPRGLLRNIAPVISLGAGSEGVQPREAVGGCGDDPVSPLRHLRKYLQSARLSHIHQVSSAVFGGDDSSHGSGRN